jgi:uncharacterized membrane protein YtjA (UPF0391 family)
VFAAGYTMQRDEDYQINSNKNIMLTWSITFFILALIAAVFGFGGIADAAAGIAQFLFVVFVILFVASFFFKGANRADRELDRRV